MRSRTKFFQRSRDAFGLQGRKLQRERAPFFGHVQQPLAAIARTFPLHDIALIHQLLEDAAERLLGDAQKLEQVGDLHARIAIDEVEHAMMGAAKAEFG